LLLLPFALNTKKGDLGEKKGGGGGSPKFSFNVCALSRGQGEKGKRRKHLFRLVQDNLLKDMGMEGREGGGRKGGGGKERKRKAFGANGKFDVILIDLPP